MKKKILFVCLGNICRSPAAESVFLHHAQSKGLKELYEVDSAGTGGWHVGHEADPRMRNAALKRGIKITSRARKINISDFTKFDLILTMDNQNFEDVNSLAEKCTEEKKAIISPILSFSHNNNLKEVPDPYYGGENGFNDVLDLLEDAVKGLLSSYQ